jgi:hypothetical protein
MPTPGSSRTGTAVRRIWAAVFPVGQGAMKDEGVSPGLTQFLDRLSPEERTSLADLLRQPRTYLAEDISDVLAILRSLEE